jgi:alkanesulfonate monooxygenase SsuD/methylene tetrahydromethanopterin reductase-like flavin-dependent oxidoreductase (luciferase family)
VQFGISLVASGPREQPTLASMLRDRIEMVRTAQGAGFALVSAGQHYAAQDQLLPQPIPLLARLAGEAPGMHLQAGVLLGPFYHPVVLAEEAALLGAMTGNRFRAAIGLGYRDHEFALFGQTRSDRVRRVIELLDTTRQLLRGETVTTSGGFYPMRDVTLTPGSVEGPPPRLMIGTGVLTGAARAARRADGLYITGYALPSDVAELVSIYRGTCAEVGADLPPLVTLAREVTVAASRRDALSRSVTGWIRTLRSYLSSGLETRSLARLIGDLESQGDSDELPFIVGSPEECAQQVARYSEAGVDEIVIRFDLWDASQSAVLGAIEEFGEKVIPLVNDA